MLLRIASLLLFIIVFSSCRKSLFDSEYFEMNYDGVKRTYLLHVPEAYSEAQPTPLLIALHGGTGSAKNVESQSGLPTLSDEKGFILCSPNGYKRTWNAGWCCGKSEANNTDDVGFISALIDQLMADYNIDPNRVYVTGMSNGAMMSYRLACELGDRFAAIAPVAGTMVFDCEPAHPINIIHFHSTEDNSVPLHGGMGNGLSDHYNTPIDSVFNFWTRENECGYSTRHDNDCTVLTSIDCNDSTEVQFYITTDGGHSWPGGTQPRRKADEPSQQVDANALMWEFFVAHPKR